MFSCPSHQMKLSLPNILIYVKVIIGSQSRSRASTLNVAIPKPSTPYLISWIPKKGVDERLLRSVSISFYILLRDWKKIFGQQLLKCEAGTRVDNGISYRSAAWTQCNVNLEWWQRERSRESKMGFWDYTPELAGWLTDGRAIRDISRNQAGWI